MPTILRVGPYRFFFYSADRGEPPHVHATREEMTAKLWLDPVRLERSGGFGRQELRRITRIVDEHRETLMESWDEHFND